MTFDFCVAVLETLKWAASVLREDSRSLLQYVDRDENFWDFRVEALESRLNKADAGDTKSLVANSVFVLAALDYYQNSNAK